MKKQPDSCCKECVDKEPSNDARRKFLQGAAVAAGGMVLGLQSDTRADVVTLEKEEQLLPLSPEVLSKVGSFEIVETPDDKIIVARTTETSIVACSAICTHKGCTVAYEHASGQFVCPCHGARYETSGKVAKGPAKRDLKAYKTRAVLGVV